MKVRRTFETDELAPATAVLENYLEGAIYDYEQNAVDNEWFIEKCIYALEILSHPLVVATANDYRKRFEKAKDERIKSL